MEDVGIDLADGLPDRVRYPVGARGRGRGGFGEGLGHFVCSERDCRGRVG